MRHEMLIVSSLAPIAFKSAKNCTVVKGNWFGVYTGKTFTNASDVDIDHIVPLAHAHRSGAASWSREEKRVFANDIENLLVVDDSANQAKSDKAPQDWLPPRRDYWYEYGRKWEHVKNKYGLKFSDSERQALLLLARNCL